MPSSTTTAKPTKRTLLATKSPSRLSARSTPTGERSRSPRQAMRPTPARDGDEEEADEQRARACEEEKACTLCEHARAREERAEDREGEGGDGERQVPDAKEPAAVLDDDRVDVGRRRQPRQQRGVLDRVPAPEAAPAEHLVAPPRAEHDADRERAPGQHRPAPLLERPAVVHPAGDEHRDGEGEGHGEADEAGVEQRRVHRRPAGCPGAGRWARRPGRRTPALATNGSAGPDHQEGEERADAEQHQRRPADDGVARLRAGSDATTAERHAGEQQRPQQQRALERRPHAR